MHKVAVKTSRRTFQSYIEEPPEEQDEVEIPFVGGAANSQDRSLLIRQQFEVVIAVGLKYRDERSASVCVPYVKSVFPEMERIGDTPITSIALFCFPDAEDWKPHTQRQTHTFALTDEVGNKIFGYCRTVMPAEAKHTIATVYCVVSANLDRAYYFQVLDEIEKRHGLANRQMKSFLEALYAEKVPQLGMSVIIKCPGLDDDEEEITLSRPSTFLMDNADTNRLQHHLKVNDLIAVFGSLLTEQRTIFCSEKPEVLTECIHALMSVLYPFAWQHTLIPILPASMIDVLCAPTPYIIGILSANLKPHLEELHLEECLIFDLDKRRLIREVGKEALVIPKRVRKVLAAALNKIGRASESQSKSISVSQAFLWLFAELLGHYSQHMTPFKNGRRTFNYETFRDFAPRNQAFLDMFSQTNMFEKFIAERSLPPNLYEYFEQFIENRKVEEFILRPPWWYKLSKRLK